MQIRVFISSVQREFAEERRRLVEYIRQDGVVSEYPLNDDTALISIPAETTEKTTEKILRLLTENPCITNRELATICGLTEDGIYYNIMILKQKGVLERIGSDKDGFWKVNDANLLTEDTVRDTVRDTVKDTAKDTVLKVNDRQRSIVEIMKEQPSVYAEDLAVKVGINIRNVKRNLAKLKQMGIIERVGSDKNGYWKVNIQ